jgi:neutral trehalase
MVGGIGAVLKFPLYSNEAAPALWEGNAADDRTKRLAEASSTANIYRAAHLTTLLGLVTGEITIRQPHLPEIEGLG